MTIVGTPVSASTAEDTDIIAAIQALTAYSVQSAAEDTAGTNTDASILYDTASRTQGNYTIFKAIASAKVAEDLLRAGKTASDAWTYRAYALIIADQQAKKDPDWAAKSVSFEGYSVSRGDTKTGYMLAYDAMLDALALVDSSPFSDQDGDGIVQTKDAEDYPDSWRLSGIDPTDDTDPF